MLVEASRPLRLLFVCDFASVHSRTYLEYFARRPQQYEITVLSTSPAAPVENVALLPLLLQKRSERVRAGISGRVAYEMTLRAPRLYRSLRVVELLHSANTNAKEARRLSASMRPDILHAFRTQPESLVALEIKRHLPEVPFFVSTWGQDFVVWAKGSWLMHRRTRAVIEKVDYLLPDNARDDRLARTEFGLRPAAFSRVMPAAGGLDVEQLDEAAARSNLSPVLGSPTLLSMRGFENIYIRIRILLEAFRRFLSDHPAAHLYLDGPAGHPGEAAVRKWIDRFELAGHVTVVHDDRATMLRRMQLCDLYVSATLTDGLPMSLLEALYFGQVPVVMRHESTCPPLVDGVNGIAVDVLDPAALAAAWKRALPLVSDRVERTRRNRKTIRADYERNPNLARVAALYAEAAHGRPPTGEVAL